MKVSEHKSIRRLLLEILYGAYLEDPLWMVEPEVFFEVAAINQKNIVPNMHYLHDRGLVEMMMGYTPPMFTAVRIRAAGIDLVEDHYKFNLQFPPRPSESGGDSGILPHLVEQLVAQGDLSPLEGWVRRQLLNDIQFLRDELAQPRDQWRDEVIEQFLAWIGKRNDESGGALSVLPELRRAIEANCSPRPH